VRAGGVKDAVFLLMRATPFSLRRKKGTCCGLVLGKHEERGRKKKNRADLYFARRLRPSKGGVELEEESFSGEGGRPTGRNKAFSSGQRSEEGIWSFWGSGLMVSHPSTSPRRQQPKKLPGARPGNVTDVKKKGPPSGQTANAGAKLQYIPDGKSVLFGEFGGGGKGDMRKRRAVDGG